MRMTPEQSARMAQHFEAMNENRKPPMLGLHGRAILFAFFAFFIAGAVIAFADKAISQAAYDAVNHEVMK